MAELSKLETALRNAHNAGDTAAAKTLANAIQQQRAEKPEEAHWGHKVGAVIDGAAQGATFGFSDEIAAGLGTGFGHLGDYDDALKAERDRMAENQRLAGGYRMAGELGGALGSGFGLAKMGVTAMKNAKTLPALIRRGAIDGLGYGAVAGAGYSEGDLADRAKGAALGASAGAVMGSVTPAVLSGGSAIGRLLKDKITSNIGPAANQAKARMKQVVRQSGMTPDEITNKLDDLGPEGMIVDTLGAPGHALGRSASNASPVARETLENASTARMAGQPDRLTDSLLKASGLDQPRTLQELQSAAETEAKPAIKAAYEHARSLGHDIDLGSFSQMLQSDMMRKAHAQGQRLSRERMVADGLSGEPSSLAVLDEAKKSLDAMAQPAMGVSANNQQTIAASLSKRLRNQIDKSLPEYGDARGLAKDLYDKNSAIALGADGAKPRVPSDFARQVASINPTHKESLAQGYAGAKIDQINNRRSTPGAVDALFGPVRQQNALNSALGANASGVRNQIAAERTFGRTDAALKGGSTTARQLADMGVTGTMGAGLGFASGGDASSTGLGVFASLLARRGGGAALQKLSARKEAQIAPLLAEALVGRELSKEAAKQINNSPALQKLLVRAISLQSGGVVGEAATTP